MLLFIYFLNKPWIKWERHLFSFPDQQELHRKAAIMRRVCVCAVEAGCHPEEEPCKDVRGDRSHVGSFKTSANADTSYGKTSELDRTDWWYYTDTTIEYLIASKYISAYCLICISNYIWCCGCTHLNFPKSGNIHGVPLWASAYKILDKYSFSPQPCDEPVTNFLNVLWK